jgi:hypothetical protein
MDMNNSLMKSSRRQCRTAMFLRSCLKLSYWFLGKKEGDEFSGDGKAVAEERPVSVSMANDIRSFIESEIEHCHQFDMQS